MRSVKSQRGRTKASADRKPLTGLIIDMRSPVQYRDGTIPGAVNKTLRQLTELQRLPNKQQPVYLFGDSDTVLAAQKYLTMFGFMFVRIVEQFESHIIPSPTRL